jgi:hypothetical protein
MARINKIILATQVSINWNCDILNKSHVFVRDHSETGQNSEQVYRMQSVRTQKSNYCISEITVFNFKKVWTCWQFRSAQFPQTTKNNRNVCREEEISKIIISF